MKKKKRNLTVLSAILFLALVTSYFLTNKNLNWNKIQISLLNKDGTAHSNSTWATKKTSAKQGVETTSMKNTTKAVQPTTYLQTYLQKSCDNPLSLVFVKVHKTGSSTVRNILEKHKKKHDPHNELLPFPFPYVGGYPGSFRRNLTVFDSKSTKGQLSKPEQRFDITTNHIRFHKDGMKETMNPNAKYVTSMRDPRRQFESSFYYFYSRWRDGHNRRKIEVSCWEYPYLYVTNGCWVTFSEYIVMAGNSLNESAPWFFRSRNFQAYELGLDPLNLDEQYAFQEVKKLDETFDLVVIFEHLLESLVLLKELLCIDWKDLIVPPPTHAGKYEPQVFTKVEDEILTSLTRQDQILYEHFNASLWRKVDAYGRDRMERDVAELKGCINGKGAAQKNKAKKQGPAKRKPVPQHTRQDTETEAMNLVREMSKSKRLPSKKVLHDIAQYMVENYGWCPTQFH